MIQKPAQTSVPISELLANRWSPRVYDPTHRLSQDQIARLQESARWAPSGNNNQPWRFAFLTRESALFQEISQKALTGFNQSWAPKASLYVVALADQKRPDGNDFKQHDSYFNNALATGQIVYEAEAMGLKAHYMGGVIHDEILRLLEVEDAWVTCVITVGMQGDLTSVTQELAQRESAERTRKALPDIIIRSE